MALNLNTFVDGLSPMYQDFPILDGANASHVDVNVGDFVWYDLTNATLKPVGTTNGLIRTWSSESRAIRDARAKFVGIAEFEHNRLHGARTESVRVGGRAKVKVASATYKRGQLLGFKKDSGGNYLYSNQLAGVTSPLDAVAISLTAGTTITELECALLGSKQIWAAIVNSMRRETFHADATIYAAGGDVVTDYTFGYDVKVCRAVAIVTTLTAGASVATLKNGANSLDDTLTVPDASAVGVVVSQAIADANSYDEFKHDDAFDLAVDATPTAGAVDYIIEHYPLITV